MDDLLAAASKVLDVINSSSSDHSSGNQLGLQQKMVAVRECMHILDDALPLKDVGAGGDNKSGGHLAQELVKVVLILLEKVKEKCGDTLDDAERTSLGAADVSVLSKLVQFAVQFGVRIHLEPGVGHPEKMSSLTDSLSLRERIHMMCQNCRAVSSCCETITIRNSLAVTCLGDIVAGFMQLCFSPASARLLDIEERKKCLKQLNEILDSWIPKEQVVTLILVLQGNASTNAPRWLQNKCGQLLSRIMVEESGVSLIVLAMVKNFFSGSQPADGGEWKRAAAIASVISTLPAKGLSAEEYCKLVCPQLVAMLAQCSEDQTEITMETSRIAVAAIHSFQEKYPDISTALLPGLVTPPLAKCCIGDEFKNDVTADDLCACIESLHQICLHISGAQEALFLNLVQPYLRFFLRLICDTMQTVAHLPPLAKDLIINCLRANNGKMASQLFLSMYGNDNSGNLKVPHDGITFKTQDDGTVIPVLNIIKDPSEILLSQDVKVEVLLDILLHCEVEGIVGEVFLLLVKSLCDPAKNIPTQVEQDGCLLTDEDKAACSLKLNESRFITFALLTALCETVDPTTLLSDVSQMISFIKVVLTNFIEQPESKESTESLNTCVSVVGLCLMSEVTSKEKRLLTELVPVLQRLSESGRIDGNTKEMISDLTIAISSFSAVGIPDLSLFSKSLQEQAKLFDSLETNPESSSPPKDSSNVCGAKQSKSQDNHPRPLIEEIETSRTETKSSKHAVSKPEKGAARAKSTPAGSTDIVTDMSFEEAFEALYDPSPALRGGAIRYLTKCIERKVPDVLEKQHELVEVFTKCLIDKDSFVYLSAVQGLAVIGSTTKDKKLESELLDKLVSDFLNRNTSAKTSPLAIDVRMKIGEVITRIITQMGDMAAHHAVVLLPELLLGARHPDADMRASCLSNLSEISLIAPHRLTPIQYEVKDCLCDIAKSDPDEMVRRAAVHCMRRLVAGLSYRFLQVFPAVAKDMYRTLKHCYEVDDDSGVQLHAQLALEELDITMREAIFKPQRLEKKITVLPT